MKTKEQIALEQAEAQLAQATTKEQRRELRESMAGLRKAADKANKAQAKELLPNFPRSKTTRSGAGYQYALEAILREGACVTVGVNSGSGRYSSSKDYTTDTVIWLDANDYQYETGNAARRGGRAGAWVRVIGKKA